MNKVLLSTFFILVSSSLAYSISEIKKQKIAELFELTNNKEIIEKMWEPIFKNLNLTDEKAKKTAMDKYFENIKQDYIPTYDKYFNDNEIDEMLKYHKSATGKKFVSLTMDLNKELGKAYSSMMGIIQELLPKPEAAAPQPQASSSNVIHFDDIAKGKNEKEVRDLFNKELLQDGLTAVKFSATWCGPCKSYAPDFEKVANELKEIAIGDKKVTVKYIATDIEATPVTAQDYSVVSIPTTIFFKNGQKIDSQAGYITSEALKARIQELAKK